MQPNPKILILYANYGDGHMQVSKALADCFQKSGANAVLMVDLFAEAHPLMHAITRFAYLKSSVYSPRLYGWSYALTQNMRSDQSAAKWVNALGIRKLKEIISREKPDAVINTFPLMSMNELRKIARLRIPTYTVLTDFVLHRRWLHPHTDKFFVATEDLKERLLRENFPAERISVSGIPIRESFWQPIDNRACLERYGLAADKSVVLIMAGAYGVTQHFKMLAKTLLAFANIQIILVCGKNRALQKKLNASFADVPNVHVFGFVEAVHELMAVSSCMITKAGGVTFAEALAMRLPVVVFRPLPGQEKGNAQYFAAKGAALIATNLYELKEHVHRILADNSLKLQITQAMALLQRPLAAKAVVAEILRDLECGAKSNAVGKV
ncbi:MAG TPA: glycosyltransferase [Bacilli bacterium]